MGFEPTNGSLGSYCLTTWRHPLDVRAFELNSTGPGLYRKYYNRFTGSLQGIQPAAQVGFGILATAVRDEMVVLVRVDLFSLVLDLEMCPCS